MRVRFHYAALIQQFAKGMAYANTYELKKARGSLTKLESLMYEKDLHVVHSTLLITQKVLQGDILTGYQTPATVYGEDLVLYIPGIKREIISDNRS